MSQIEAKEFRDAARRLRSLGVAADVAELLEAQALVARRPTAGSEESPELNELAAALAKAQGQMSNAVKDRENTFLHSNYADLASVWDACRAALSENGLAIVQRASPTPDRMSVDVVTTLLHSSGQWMHNRQSVPVEQTISKDGKKQTWIQAYGSVVTYARRYAVAAMVGIAAADEDDDGNAYDERPRTALDDAREKARRLAEQKVAQKPKAPPTVRFGDLKGKPLAEVTTDDLIKIQELGGEKIGKEPKADWVPSLRENLQEIGAEIERRIAADDAKKTSPQA